MNGFAGKILRVDLTGKTITTIETRKYENWGGGHGMGSALFWDLVEDKTIDGFDAKNVVTIMTSPLSGTLVRSQDRSSGYRRAIFPYWMVYQKQFWRKVQPNAQVCRLGWNSN
jgi:hypothetical protein